MIMTIVGFLWLDIPSTENADASYLVQVSLIINIAHSFHILFQNPFHQIEKSDIVGIQYDQCDILWKCTSWINKGFLFAIWKKVLKRSSPLTPPFSCWRKTLSHFFSHC
jgi:hypothetical protein